MDPVFVVDAAILGKKDIVMNILRADPSYLLKKAKVKNSVGVEYDVTPLQAAIMTTDIQMAEKMKRGFERLTADLNDQPIDGIAEMHRQIKDIYLKSLRSLQPDTQVSESDDISVIIGAHNQAQEANAFDFKPYVEAILAASQAELDVVMQLINTKPSEEAAQVAASTGVSVTQTDEARAKSFDELTLVEKLNRFREEFVLVILFGIPLLMMSLLFIRLLLRAGDLNLRCAASALAGRSARPLLAVFKTYVEQKQQAWRTYAAEPASAATKRRLRNAIEQNC